MVTNNKVVTAASYEKVLADIEQQIADLDHERALLEATAANIRRQLQRKAGHER